MIIMAVDYGDARTGIAVCDKMEFLASPVTVIEEWNAQKCLEKVAAAARETRAEEIIVGFPKNMDGSVGGRAEKCAAFAEELGKLTEITVKLWDERRTTITAHQMMNETNTRGKKRKAVIDAVAATVILESYLAFRKNTAQN